MRLCIFGENSKIGKSLKKHLPKGFTLVSVDEAPDYLLLATNSDKAKQLFAQYHKQFKIIDFSGAYKPEALSGQLEFTYGFDPKFDKTKSNIVFPGCSSLAILQALYPIRNIIVPDSLFADVKFSKSAVQYKSARQESIQDTQIEIVNPFNHFHEKEINHVLTPLQMKMVPSVVNVPQGLFINVFFNINSQDSVEKLLQDYYVNSQEIVFNQKLAELLDTNKTSLAISQEKHRVCISIITDNLVNGKIFTFLKSQ